MQHTPLNYALWLLGRRDRSVGEIKAKLTDKKYSDEETKKAIDFLCKNDFLNDERFAKNYIRNQLSMRPLGEYQLKMRLKNKFVSEENIKKALEESNIDEKKLVEAALSKWLKINGKKEKKYDRVTRHLLGRGFKWEVVKEVMENHKKLF